MKWKKDNYYNTNTLFNLTWLEDSRSDEIWKWIIYKHPIYQTALELSSTKWYINFHLRYFTSPEHPTSGFNFHLHSPHYISFLLCLPLHWHLVWFTLPFLLLSLSSNFTTFSAYVASCQVATLGPNTIIILQSGKHPVSVLLRIHKS